MKSSYGKIFRITGPLWGESTGHWWIPLTKPSDVERWSAPEQTTDQTIETLVIWNAIGFIITWLQWKSHTSTGKFSYISNDSMVFDTCGKLFQTTQCLRIYQRRDHDKEPKHTCQVYDKGFMVKTLYWSHAMSHGGVHHVEIELLKVFSRQHIFCERFWNSLISRKQMHLT